MRIALVSIVAVIVVLALVGCEDDNNGIFDPVPAAPQGVYSVTGDKSVYLYWYGPYESDIVEYIIWRSNQPLTGYTERGRRSAEPNPNLDLIIYEYIDEGADVDNGTTYYYAVSSVDRAGQMSELSAEEVMDTPRPEGIIKLFDVAVDSTRSGFLFGEVSTYANNISVADVYVDRYDDIFYLNAGNEQTDLQDMGYTDTFSVIGYAPQDGWSQVGWVEIILGHTYVIWTDDSHYAKMRAQSINPHSVTFEWAYQTAPNNPELIVRPGGLEKPVHGAEYLQKKNTLSPLK
ncbi:MAG: hypothetical protein ACE5K8_08875 [Candidatus Zixiibacteriota bacterium]